MAGAALSTPELLFYFPAESIASLTRRWQDWVSRGATVATRKDQAQDCPARGSSCCAHTFFCGP